MHYLGFEGFVHQLQLPAYNTYIQNDIGHFTIPRDVSQIHHIAKIVYVMLSLLVRITSHFLTILVALSHNDNVYTTLKQEQLNELNATLLRIEEAAMEMLWSCKELRTPEVKKYVLVTPKTGVAVYMPLSEKSSDDIWVETSESDDDLWL